MATKFSPLALSLSRPRMNFSVENWRSRQNIRLNWTEARNFFDTPRGSLFPRIYFKNSIGKLYKLSLMNSCLLFPFPLPQLTDIKNKHSNEPPLPSLNIIRSWWLFPSSLTHDNEIKSQKTKNQIFSTHIYHNSNDSFHHLWAGFIIGGMINFIYVYLINVFVSLNHKTYW